MWLKMAFINLAAANSAPEIDLFDLFRTNSRSLCDVFYESDIYGPEGSTFYDNFIEEVWGDPLNDYTKNW